MIQQRIPHSGSPQGHVWVDPSRDIAHAFPGYIRRALELAEHDVNVSGLDSAAKQAAIAQLQSDAKILAAFIKLSYGEGRTASIQEAFKLGKVLDPKTPSAGFSRALTKVLLSAYWIGLGSALHGQQEKPIDSELVDQYIKATD